MPSTTVKRKANLTERKIARKWGGKRTPLSGAMFGGDVSLGDWNIEVKTTSRSSYSLRVDDIVNGQSTAFAEEQRFAMYVTIGDLNVWVIPESEITVSPEGPEIC